MNINRRAFLTGTAAFAAGVTPLRAQPILALGRDVTTFGVRPGSPDDQTRNLQRAIDEAAKARVPLALPPGTYRASTLTMREGTQLVGVRGATKIEFSGGGPSLLTSNGAGNISLSGLTLDGLGIPLPQRRGLVHCTNGKNIRVTDCDITTVSGAGIWFEAVSGEVRGSSFTDIAVTAIVSFDAAGLLIAQNTMNEIGDNGIEILRQRVGADGTMVIDNRIENVHARSGGTGQYGNAINAFRAGNVLVRGNRIVNCAFTGVRGNSASGIQILGNSVTNAGEVALYSEFAFEAAIIANNIVDGASTGISVANFNEGGRIAVVQGNIIRNLRNKTPYEAISDDIGVGLYVEADATVTGNVVENAPFVGIMAGWGKYLRDVAITGNVVRDTFIGVGVSALPGAGTTLVSDNVISGAKRGAIVGMDHAKPVTADLTRPGAEKLAHLGIGQNQVR
jgi:uncharacterized secreted repeat protein (TIGR03808 family)